MQVSDGGQYTLVGLTEAATPISLIALTNTKEVRILFKESPPSPLSSVLSH